MSNPPTARGSAICVLCQEPAMMICGSCKDAPSYHGLVSITNYGSRACQIVNRAAHKTLCRHLKTRKMLFKAGDRVQAIFYMYQENLFDKPVIKVDLSDGKLWIHEGNYDVQVVNLDFLFPFPNNLNMTPKYKKGCFVISFLY
ncbi:hypothetical protein B0J14DRAFT_684649 [Halenospora varia]|nr:hypothetical protein B0J14DRAFT_684649 [Halenospora varia]